MVSGVLRPAKLNLVRHFDYHARILVLPLSAAQLSNRGWWWMGGGEV